MIELRVVGDPAPHPVHAGIEAVYGALLEEAAHVRAQLAKARARELKCAADQMADARKDADGLSKRLQRAVRSLASASAELRKVADAERARLRDEAQRARDEERQARANAQRALKLSRSRRPEERAEFALGLLNELPLELVAAVIERGRQRIEKMAPALAAANPDGSDGAA
jgi:ABC-type transporter Mla subunit MlaD